MDVFDLDDDFDAVAAGCVVGELFEVALFVDVFVAAPETEDVVVHFHDEVAFEAFGWALPDCAEAEVVIIMFLRLEIFDVKFEVEFIWGH